jgi:RsiW-degrading membrane proteinase PrsW (M82 family)
MEGKKKLTKNDGMKLFGFAATLIAGLWALWRADISNANLILHIKFIYSLFLTLAIFISAYYIIFKMENKKNGKEK